MITLPSLEDALVVVAEAASEVELVAAVVSGVVVEHAEAAGAGPHHHRQLTDICQGNKPSKKQILIHR